jgi:hypothetical protein
VVYHGSTHGKATYPPVIAADRILTGSIDLRVAAFIFAYFIGANGLV